MEVNPTRDILLTKRFVSYLHTKNCDVNIVKHMISLGADVNYKDRSLNTLIHIVLRHCDDKANLLHGLLVAGTRLNVNNIHGKSAVHYAILYSDDVAVLRELIAHGADICFRDNDSPLHLAVQMNKKSFVEELIRSGADVNLKNSKGETPLIISIRNGNLDIVKVLLSSKADVLLDRESMLSPLHEAVECPVPNQSILIELMKWGADIFEKRDLSMRSPIQCAIEKYYADPSDNLRSARTLVKCAALQINRSIHLWHQCTYLKKYDVYPQLNAFFEECILEFRKMCNEFINGSVATLLGFVLEGFEYKKPMYLKKSVYRELLFNQILNVARNYPAYTDIIAYYLGKLDLSLKSMELYVYTFKDCPEGKRCISLTPDAIFLIAGFLSEEDILNLITAFSGSQHFAIHDLGFQSLELGKSTKRKLDWKC